MVTQTLSTSNKVVTTQQDGNLTEKPLKKSETRRVVSLLPFLTDIVQELQLTDLLVGVSHECEISSNIPRLTKSKANLARCDALEISSAWNQTTINQPITLQSKICSYYDVNIPELSSVNPTHILTHIANARTILQPDVEQVEQAVYENLPGVLQIASLSANTLAEVYSLHHHVAHSLGVPTAAVQPIASARASLHNVKALIEESNLHRGRRASMAVVQWTHPMYLAGGWVPDVLQSIGIDTPAPMPVRGSPSQTTLPKELCNFDYVLFVNCAVPINITRKIVNEFWKKHGSNINKSDTRYVIADGAKLFSWLGVTNIVRTAEVAAEVVTGSSAFRHANALWEEWNPPY